MRPLDPHQVIGVKFIKDHSGRALLGMAPGTGKTLTAIRAIDEYPVLIVCRRDDFLTWKTELIADGAPETALYTIDSGNAALPVVTQDTRGEWPIKWYMVTYDLCKNPRVQAWIKDNEFSYVVADELHMIKRYKSKRSKAVIKSTRHIQRRLGLTGTPITNDPIDVFAECLFIDNGRLFGNNEWYFRKDYYLKSGPGWYLRQGAKAKIALQLKKIAYHVHEDDVLSLPVIRPIKKSAPMSGMQRRYYEQVLDEWELEIRKGEIIEIDQVIVQLAKLRQIAGGFYYTPLPDRQVVRLKCPKLDLLQELIEDNDYIGSKPKIVIWGSLTGELVRICEMLQVMKQKHVLFFGRMARKKKEASRAQFRDDPKTRFFVGQVDSGVGMNELVVADTAVYYSNSHRVVSRQQSERRIRRRGSEIHASITYYDLITENSTDLPLLQNLGKSMSLASMILQELKKGTPLRKLVT